MPAKTKSEEGNSNNNVNTNTNTINVNIKYPDRRYAKPKYSSVKEKSSPNWYVRAVVGGIIALVLSVFGYYLKQRVSDGNHVTPASLPAGNQIEGVKHN